MHSTATLYGVRELVDGMRAVRRNTILMADDIRDSAYGFRATPQTRSVAETLVHIAWLWTSDRVIHEEHRIETVEGFDFDALMATSTVQEKVARSKAEILELLRVEGERAVEWIEGLPEGFWPSASDSRAAARSAASSGCSPPRSTSCSTGGSSRCSAACSASFRVSPASPDGMRAGSARYLTVRRGAAGISPDARRFAGTDR